MKKNRVLIGLLPLLLASCTYGSYSITTGKLTMNNKEMKGNYNSMTGYIARKFKVSTSKGYNFHLDMQNDEENQGELYFLISLKGETKTKYEVGTYDFSLREEGEYELRFQADHHRGSFSLTWSSLAL